MKKLNSCLFLLLGSLQQLDKNNNILPNFNFPLSAKQLNRMMCKYLVLKKSQVPKIMKINARYLGRVEDVLAYEAGQKKNTNLMRAWDNWMESLEEILTEKQFHLLLSWNHEVLWNQQVNEF